MSLSAKQRRALELCTEELPNRVSANGVFFQYHSAFQGMLSETSDVLSRYFKEVGLKVYRVTFPPQDADDRRALSLLKQGVSDRIWRNFSIVPSDSNATPAQWSPSRRIHLTKRDELAASTTGLSELGSSQGGNLRGFVLCLCLESSLESLPHVVYTPVLGAYVSASADEQFQDREVKGLFCWRHFSREVQIELQQAFLLALLLDAAWWAVEGRSDRTEESKRYVSIPVTDLVLFPFESLELLDAMDDKVVAQHWQIEGRSSINHSMAKCSCSRFKDDPQASSYVMISTGRLRQAIETQRKAVQRARAEAHVRAVYSGRPSSAVVGALEVASRKLRHKVVRHNAPIRLKRAPSEDSHMAESSKKARTGTPSGRSRSVVCPTREFIPGTGPAKTAPPGPRLARRSGPGPRHPESRRMSDGMTTSLPAATADEYAEEGSMSSGCDESSGSDSSDDDGASSSGSSIADSNVQDTLKQASRIVDID